MKKIVKVIMAAAAVVALAVPAMGADKKLIVKDAAGTGEVFSVDNAGGVVGAGWAWDTVNKRMGFNTITPAASLQVLETTGVNEARGIAATQHNDGAQGAQIMFRKSRGPEADPGKVAGIDAPLRNGDWVGMFMSQPFDLGSLTYTRTGQFGFRVDGIVSNANVPTAMSFWAGPSTLGMKEGLRISSTNNVVVGNNAAGSLTQANLATTATGGFLYIPAVSGTLTSCGAVSYKTNGTASTVGEVYSGHAPVWFDATGNKICACNGTVLKCTAAML